MTSEKSRKTGSGTSKSRIFLGVIDDYFAEACREIRAGAGLSSEEAASDPDALSSLPVGEMKRLKTFMNYRARLAEMINSLQDPAPAKA